MHGLGISLAEHFQKGVRDGRHAKGGAFLVRRFVD
jgi:hypothetical protein